MAAGVMRPTVLRVLLRGVRRRRDRMAAGVTRPTVLRVLLRGVRRRRHRIAAGVTRPTVLRVTYAVSDDGEIAWPPA